MPRIRSLLYLFTAPSGTISHMNQENHSNCYYVFPQADLTCPDLGILSACTMMNKATLDYRWTPGQWAGIARAYCFNAHEAAHMYLTGWNMGEVEDYADWVASPHPGADCASEVFEGSYIVEYDQVNFRHTNYAQRDKWMHELAPMARAYRYM